MLTEDELIARARAVSNPRRLTITAEAGTVASALVTAAGNVYTGVNIDTACSLGFCAEHSAIAAMITAGESEIKMIVAVNEHGDIYAPCGRCREFIWQVNENNRHARVLHTGGRSPTVEDLLPSHWKEDR
ncbi:MAG: cytidine deaminase [Alphaproteobacteria bacterium]